MATEMSDGRERAEALTAQHEEWIRTQPAYIAMPTLREKEKLAELFMTCEHAAYQRGLRDAIAACEGQISDGKVAYDDWTAGYVKAVEDTAQTLTRLAEGGGDGQLFHVPRV